jgi:hypothetical protein
MRHPLHSLRRSGLLIGEHRDFPKGVFLSLAVSGRRCDLQVMVDPLVKISGSILQTRQREKIMTIFSRPALITGCGKATGISNATDHALAAGGIVVVGSDVAPAGVANEHNARRKGFELGRSSLIPSFRLSKCYAERARG